MLAAPLAAIRSRSALFIGHRKPTKIAMTILLAIAALLGASVNEPAPIPAVIIRSTLTADNGYMLGLGTANQINTLTAPINNDESGQIFSCGIPGAEKYLGSAPMDGYVYIVAWSDNAVSNGVIGQFKCSTLTPAAQYPVHYTGVGNWQVFATGIDVNTLPAPTLAGVNGQIQLANINGGVSGATSVGWVSTLGGGEGTLANGEANEPGAADLTCGNAFGEVCTLGPNRIDQAAHWMWYQRPGSSCAFIDGNHREYLIFRIPVADLLL